MFRFEKCDPNKTFHPITARKALLGQFSVLVLSPNIGIRVSLLWAWGAVVVRRSNVELDDTLLWSTMPWTELLSKLNLLFQNMCCHLICLIIEKCACNRFSLAIT